MLDKLNLTYLLNQHQQLISHSKFTAANNMWLSDIPTQLQGLTIPEQKLISLHRHNSCVIKLHSLFHTATTAQGALKGNCITFLQNMSNIVSSLPLTMDDLCHTLKEQELSERAGYDPDPLLNPMESGTSDSDPMNDSAVLDVNGPLVSSDEINNYVLTKIKNGGTDNQIDVDNVYLIPHSSKPVNE
ncbi:unnamed protein product, partial [Adineta ricciae]